MKTNQTRRCEGDGRRSVILTSGERLLVDYDDHLGVHTDAGCHPWADCEAFECWSDTLHRMVVVPLS